ncbi:unnamed protein product [Ectocarpus sp. CCAP 1310/34]|nr:unnamed protein product [Ectocarpus sp. CCAP 1310/34]
MARALSHEGCASAYFPWYPSIDFYLNRYTFAYGVSWILVRISLGAHLFS